MCSERFFLSQHWSVSMELPQTAEFWIGLIKIIWINIILSGDNAVVIALAARSLKPQQQKQAIMFGSGAAVVLRIVLTVVAAQLLALSFLQIVGGLLLLWIGIQLLGEEEGEEGVAKESGGMFAAVRTILIADLVMSLDNVIAVAAAAKGSMVLLILGLAISIPLVVFGATLMVKLMERFPTIITLGAALIGWVAGETIVSDAVLAGVRAANPWLHYAAAVAGAVFVVGVGKLLSTRSRKEPASGH
jgi:YjbE family integral membrane protein